MSEKGEWRLVTAEGCRDGGVRALCRTLKENPGARVRTRRFGGREARLNAEEVLCWHWPGRKFEGDMYVPLWDLAEDRALWEVFHPTSKPLTAEDVEYVVRAAQGMLVGKPLSSFDDGRLRGLLGRPLPEFPRRIPFSERLPEPGKQVVYCTADGDVTLGSLVRRTGVTNPWMQTGIYFIAVESCTWWHPIAGPEAGDDE